MNFTAATYSNISPAVFCGGAAVVDYYGEDNNNYVAGEGFCCGDNNLKTKSIADDSPNYEKLQYYYHSDHLGSASYITNLDGEVVQHIEYVPFGEVFLEERNNTWNTPFLFNGKELDEETGLYYYGARYCNPRISLWYGVDPIATYNPVIETEHYIDGQHNRGVFNSFNLNVYGYCYQNPVRLVDPNGKQVDAIKNGVASGTNVINDITASVSRKKMGSINGIVLHRTVSSNASSAINTAKNNKGKTGFHLAIDKDGTTTQIVNFENGANHVGKKKGSIGNTNSIGIEVVGNYDYKNKTWEALTTEQVESTAKAVYTLMNEYNLNSSDIYPHEDISWKTAGEGQTVLDAIKGRVNTIVDQNLNNLMDRALFIENNGVMSNEGRTQEQMKNIINIHNMVQKRITENED